jgi:hypothetical protein
MKKVISKDSKKESQDRIIEEALRTGGFLFPTTVSQVIEFERIYGATDAILPSELQDPTFLHSQTKKKVSLLGERLISENFAMAAREGSSEIPSEIQKRMEEDRKKYDANRKRKEKK